MGRKMLALHGIFWYDLNSCERDPEDLNEDLQQSKIKKKLYKRMDKDIGRNKEISGLNKNELIIENILSYL